MSYKITKRYDNLKAAHRQWRHKGHCALVHGENWVIDITFRAERLDEQNFVVDFGSLREFKLKLEEIFDHTLLIDEDDPQWAFFADMAKQGLAKVVFLPSCGAEGIARYVGSLASIYIYAREQNRVEVASVTVLEDNKNSAVWENN